MKTTFAILITVFAAVTGAFADQPVFNSKGALLYMKRDTPLAGRASLIRRHWYGKATGGTCKTMLAISSNPKVPVRTLDCSNPNVRSTTACKIACAR